MIGAQPGTVARYLISVPGRPGGIPAHVPVQCWIPGQDGAFVAMVADHRPGGWSLVPAPNLPGFVGLGYAHLDGEEPLEHVAAALTELVRRRIGGSW